MKTTEIFIQEAQDIHGDKYDYSLVEYKKSNIKIKIICKKHRILFEQIPSSHLIGNGGCQKCKGELLHKNNIKTKEQFIKEAKDIHGDKYDYSLVEYNGAHKKIKIICKIHGVFQQKPSNHTNLKQCCPKCVNNNIKSTTEIFISKAKKVHGDKYDYSLVEFKNNKTNVKIICDGKIYEKSPKSHLKGIKFKSITNAEFIEKSNKIHNYKYDYSLVEFDNTKDMIKIICPIHGIFEQRLSSHYECGCPICSESKGEQQIRCFLNNNDIKYITQHKFKNCVNKRSLIFDFYLPEQNICIEYDGIQHFEYIEYFGGDERLLNIKENDKIKNKYCKNNDIRLIRIKYDKNVNEILNNLLINF